MTKDASQMISRGLMNIKNFLERKKVIYGLLGDIFSPA